MLLFFASVGFCQRPCVSDPSQKVEVQEEYIPAHPYTPVAIAPASRSPAHCSLVMPSSLQ